MRVFIANLTSGLFHVALFAAVAWWVPTPDLFELETVLARGEPILIQMSLPASTEAQVEEVEVEMPRPDPPPLLHLPPPRKELAETTPLKSQSLPPIDVIPTGKLPLTHKTEVEPTEVAAAQPESSQTPEEAKPERIERQEAKPPEPTKQTVKKTPRRIQPAPVIAQRQAVAMPFQTATSVGAHVDELPRKMPDNPAPIYPSDALLSGIEGLVTLRVLIGADGLVADVQVQKTSGSGSLDESALTAVRRWRFSPARRRGAVVAHEVLVPVRFTIRRG
jgi:protein TonB